MTVVDTTPGGVQAHLEGVGTGVATLETCHTGGAEQARLDVAGETVALTCGTGGSLTATAVHAAPLLELRTPPSGGPAVVVSLATGDTATLGSPITASADNLQAIWVALVGLAEAGLGAFALDPGESVDVTFGAPGTGTVTVLAGRVTLTVGGQTHTLGAGERLTLLTGPPALVLEALAEAVASFHAAGEIRNRGIARSLTASLEQAGRALDRARATLARRMLGVLVRKLRAFGRGGEITPVVRDALVPAITLLRSSLRSARP